MSGEPFSRMLREGGSPKPGSWDAAERALDGLEPNTLVDSTGLGTMLRPRTPREKERVTVVGMLGDFEEAAHALENAHGEFCIPADRCACLEIRDRLLAALPPEKPTPLTQEEKVASRKRWDAAVEKAQAMKRDRPERFDRE